MILVGESGSMILSVDSTSSSSKIGRTPNNGSLELRLVAQKVDLWSVMDDEGVSVREGVYPWIISVRD